MMVPTPNIDRIAREGRLFTDHYAQPPAGCANWSLRLLAEQVFELQIVESISHETIRGVLKKKPDDQSAHCLLGHSSREKC